MIKWLTDNLTLSETAEAVIPPSPETDLAEVEVETDNSTKSKETLPPSVTSLPPELQLQWLIKKEEMALNLKQREIELSISLKKEELAAAAAGKEKERAAFLKKEEIAAAEKEKERAHELALRQLDQRMPFDSSYFRAGQGPVPFKVESAVKLLPKFSEQNVEEYLITFEKNF